MSDDINNPTVLDPGGGSVDFDMTGATASVDEGYGFALPDLWYAWTPSITGMALLRFTAIAMDVSPPLPNLQEFRLSFYGAAVGVEFFHGAWAEMDHGHAGSGIRYNYAEVDIEYPTQDQLGAATIYVTAGRLYMLRLVDRRRPTSTVTGTFVWSLHEPLSSDPGLTVGGQDVLVVRRHGPTWIIPS